MEKGFCSEKKVYVLKTETECFNRKIVKRFMIADDPDIIVDTINHRKRFYHRDGCHSYPEAVELLKKKVPERKFPRFGITAPEQIELNQWYDKKKL